MVTITRVKSRSYWYVRHNSGSKTFVDSAYGGTKNAEKAMRDYIASYVEKHPEEKPKEFKISTKPSKRNTSGIVGVFKSSYKNRSGIRQSFWCASVPVGPKGQKYYRKSYSIDTYGEKDAFALAKNYREDWMTAFKNDSLKEFFSSHR